MAQPIQPSWNASAQAWLDYADECGVEVPEGLEDEHRDRIRAIVLDEVAYLEAEEYDDEEYDEDDDEPESDEDDEPEADTSDEPEGDAEPADEPEEPAEPAPPDPEQPPRNGSHAAWVEYAIAKGASPDEARKTSRDDLVSTFGS